MTRFADPPYFLLFFYTDLIPPREAMEKIPYGNFIFADDTSWVWEDDDYWEWQYYLTPDATAYLWGAQKGIWAEGGVYTHLYVRVQDGSLIGFKFRPLSTYRQGNFFRFSEEGLVRPLFTGGTSAFDPGADVFFRKDSYFHDWLRDNTDYENFVNVNKTWAYFGKIYPIGNNNYHIVYYGMKDYSYDALPETNQTSKIQEFLKVYFDEVYHETYNMSKNLSTMYDSEEIRLEYLYYLSQTMKIDIDESWEELPLREWVGNMINFLKRKGSYADIYIVWKLLLKNTLNKLRVYEKWHDFSVTGVPEEYFYDVPYTEFYGVSPSGCSRETSLTNWPQYVDTLAPSGYPSPYGPDPVGDALSPHYEVEVDLSCEPLGADYIINESTWDNLYDNWEIIRPVSKFAHYREVIAPRTDFSGQYVNLYDRTLYSSSCNTRFCSEIEAVGEFFIHYQATVSLTWTIDHDLNSNDVLVQCYNFSREQIIPDEIEIISSTQIKITFNTAVNGYAYLAKADDLHTQLAANTNWVINHGLGIEVLTQWDDDSRFKIMPDEHQINTLFTTTTTWPTAQSGYALSEQRHYKHEQTIASSVWTITHNLGELGLMVQTFDSGLNMIRPDSITVINENVCRINWPSSIDGYALIVAVPVASSMDFVMNKLSDWEIGTGTSPDFNPVSYNGVETLALSGTGLEVDETTNYYTVKFETDRKLEIDSITEVALLDDDGVIRWYTDMSPMFKPTQVGFVYYLRISKTFVN